MSQVFVLPNSPATMSLLRLVHRLAAKYDVAPSDFRSAAKDAGNDPRSDAAPIGNDGTEDAHHPVRTP